MRRLSALAATAVVLAACLSGSPAGSQIALAPRAPLDRLCADYAGGTLTVEVLGDSVMWGTGANSHAGTWHVRLATALGRSSAVWVGAGPGTVASDYLPGGGWANHTEFARAVRPSVVTMDWRINEQYLHEQGLPRGASPAALRADLTALAARIREASPETVFVVVNPPRVGEGWNQAGQDVYVEVLREVRASLGSSALWLDLDQINNDPDGLGFKTPDRIHVGPAGQAVQAEAFRNLVHGVCLGKA